MDIYVGNLPYSINEQSLQEAFEAHGQVTNVKIVTDRETGRPRGFAFVSMPDDSQAEIAINALNGQDLDGRALRVNAAQPREERPRGGGGGGGGGSY